MRERADLPGDQSPVVAHQARLYRKFQNVESGFSEGRFPASAQVVEDAPGEAGFGRDR